MEKLSSINALITKAATIQKASFDRYSLLTALTSGAGVLGGGFLGGLAGAGIGQGLDVDRDTTGIMALLGIAAGGTAGGYGGYKEPARP